MGFKDFVKSSIWRMDLLSTSPSFRTRKQPVYETIFGGLLSIVVLGVFYYFLYFELNQMFSKLTIQYSQGIEENVDSTSAITSAPFAIAIAGVNLRTTPKKFIIKAYQHAITTDSAGTVTTTNTELSIGNCSQTEWATYGNSIEAQYLALGFDEMLCLTSGQNISLKGYVGAKAYSYVYLQITECNQGTDAACDTTANINSYMNSYLSSNDYFKVNFFMLDTIITPDQDQAITKILEKNIFMSFSSTVGTYALINVAEYTLGSDTSMFPFEDYSYASGHYIEKYDTNSVSLSGSKYVVLRLQRSTKAMTITRTIGKIDTVLSYVGGLFSLLFTALVFVFGSFSTYKYQLYVAESTLTNNQGKSYKVDDFSFFAYVAYAIYDWLDCFGIAPSCMEKSKNIHMLREQSCEQLDPIMIIKRIKHLEDISKVLMSEHKQMCLYLTEPLSLDQAQKMRNTLTYYNEVLGQINENQQNISLIKKSQTDDEKKMFDFGNNNAISNDSRVSIDKKVQAKPLTQEEEKKRLNKKMAEAFEQLDKDNTELANKIRGMIASGVRQYVKMPKEENALSQDQLLGHINSKREGVQVIGMQQNSGVSINKRVRVKAQRRSHY